MMAVAPSPVAPLMAASTPSVAPVANWSSRMNATLRPGTIAQLTSGRSNCLRVMATSNGLPSPRWIDSVTGSPSGPRTRDTTSSMVSPSVVLPSTATIRSPRRSPASSAGVPGMIERMIGPLDSSSSSWTPMPTNVPDSDWSTAFASSAVRNDVWPSSPTASVMPRIAP